MSDWPSKLDRPQRVALTTWGWNSGPGEYVIATKPTVGALAWPAANRALYVPVYVLEPTTIYQLASYNGAVAGELDVGIYSYSGSGTSATRLASSGKTAMSGAETPQLFNITDQVLNPGVYFLAQVVSTITTATYFRQSMNNALIQTCGVQQQGLAETVLPATATLARPESSYSPCIMAIGNSVI